MLEQDEAARQVREVIGDVRVGTHDLEVAREELVDRVQDAMAAGAGLATVAAAAGLRPATLRSWLRARALEEAGQDGGK